MKAFSHQTRMCVASLIGMEVPAEQIGPVMGEVLSLADVDFSPKDLPSIQSALNIADECQFLVKQMYAKKLRETDSWGINKDGTSRQKKKILTSTLSMPGGEELNLGFRILAREIAQKIRETLKGDLEELELVSKFDEDGEEEPFMKTVLSNLTTLMGDRAANKKKANELLKGWRDEVLGTTDDQEKKNVVHSFYCMAHALLGFYSYASANFKQQQKTYSGEDIRLGRERSAVFGRFLKEFPVIRCVKLGADILGPVGDEKSVMRENWLAHCRLEGGKKKPDPELQGQSFQWTFWNSVSDSPPQAWHCLFYIQAGQAELESPVCAWRYEWHESWIHASCSGCSICTCHRATLGSCEFKAHSILTAVYPTSRRCSVKMERPATGATRDRDRNSNLWWISTRCRWTSLHFSLITTRRYPVLQWHTHKCVGWNPEDCPEAAERFHAWRVLWWSPGCHGDCADKICSPDKPHIRKGVWVAGCKSESKTTFDAASPLYSGDAQEAEDLLKILSPVPTPHRAAQYMQKSKERRKNAPEKNQLEEKAEQEATEDALELEAAAKEKRAAKKHSLKKTKTAATGKSRSKAANKAVAVAKRRLQGTSSASLFQCLPPVLTPKIGDWVAVAYENGWFPGHVLRADEETETYYTNFLHPCSTAGQYNTLIEQTRQMWGSASSLLPRSSHQCQLLEVASTSYPTTPPLLNITTCSEKGV